MRDSGLGGDVGERAVSIIAKQVRGRFGAWGKALESRAIYQKNIEPPIVVVIVERNTAAGGFEQILVLVPASEDGFRIQPGLTGDVEKADVQIAAVDRRFVFRRRGLLLSCARPHPARTSHRQHAVEREYKCRTAERFQKNAARREQEVDTCCSGRARIRLYSLYFGTRDFASWPRKTPFQAEKKERLSVCLEKA